MDAVDQALDGEVTVVAHTEMGWIALGVNGAWYSADGLTGRAAR